MNEHIIRKVYNTSIGDIVPFIMSNALNEIIVITETNSNGPRVMVMKPKNSNHPFNYYYLDRRQIKHTDNYDACVPLHDLDPYDTSLTANTVPPPEGAATIFKWDSPYLGDLRYNYCHVFHNLKCSCNGKIATDQVMTTNLNVSANNPDRIQLSPDVNQNLLIDNICEVNCTDGRDCEPTTHLDTGNTCNTAPVEPALYDLEGSTFHANSYLDNLKMKYPRNFFMAHLNINSIRHKFYEIYDMLNGNRIDIFGISETKISASFRNAQLNIPGFKLHRQDRYLKGNGGGIIVYIKDSIPHRILRKHSGITDGVEYMSFEVCFKKCKWFLVYVYKPPKVSDDCTWSVLSCLADCFVNNGNVTVFFGDINNDMFKDNILCDFYDLKKLKAKPRRCWMFF